MAPWGGSTTSPRRGEGNLADMALGPGRNATIGKLHKQRKENMYSPVRSHELEMDQIVTADADVIRGCCQQILDRVIPDGAKMCSRWLSKGNCPSAAHKVGRREVLRVNQERCESLKPNNRGKRRVTLADAKEVVEEKTPGVAQDALREVRKSRTECRAHSGRRAWRRDDGIRWLLGPI